MFHAHYSDIASEISFLWFWSESCHHVSHWRIKQNNQTVLLPWPTRLLWCSKLVVNAGLVMLQVHEIGWERCCQYWYIQRLNKLFSSFLKIPFTKIARLDICSCGFVSFWEFFLIFCLPEFSFHLNTGDLVVHNCLCMIHKHIEILMQN